MDNGISIRKPVVYVTGPYSADPKTGLRLAIRAGFDIYRAGGCPIVPHLTHFAEKVIPVGYDAWSEIAIGVIEVCDAIYRIPGESCGSDHEVTHALRYDIPVLFGRKSMREWITEWNSECLKQPLY